MAKNREKTRDKSVDKKDKAKEEKSSNAFILGWSHLGSNQGPTDYESATLTN